MKLTASSHRLSVAGFRVGRAREEWRERRGRKKKRKKRFNDASFCMLFFRPLQRATNEQASTRFRETWLIHYSNHETWITPISWLSRLASFEDFWRPRFCQIFSLEKIIRVNLISPLVACFPFTILKRFQLQPDPLFKRLLKVCRVVRPCFFVT